jgi:hypothetical protein
MDTARKVHSAKEEKVLTVKMKVQETMVKKVETINHHMTKAVITENIMIQGKSRREESMVTKSTTRRDLRPLDIMQKPTRKNLLRGTNTTMTSTKKEATR